MSASTLAALAPVNAASGLGPAAAAAGPTAAHAPANPAEAQRFAQLLSAPPPSAAHDGAAGSGSLLQAVQSIGQELGGTRSLQEMRASMLASVDLSDPIGTMFALTDHSLEAHAMFARLHISSGLASAATNLFGTLLKNQQ